MMLRKAIEVNFQKDPISEDQFTEAEVTGFQWDFIEFTPESLQIKLYFDDPAAVGSFQLKDYITVTFWGVNFF